jgi:hypothetical protein
MGRMTAAVDRLLAAVTAVLLISAALVVLAWRRELPWARQLADRIDLGELARYPSERWWAGALFAISALALLGAIALLVANLYRHRIGLARLGGSDRDGYVSVDLSAVARAAAEDLPIHAPGILRTRAAAVLDRGQPTIALALTADPRTDLRALIAAAETTAHEIAAALDGADVATRITIEFERVLGSPSVG